MDNPEDVTTCVEWFVGAAGNHLGLRRVVPGLRLVVACEIEAYAVANLVAKMEAGLLDPAPVWADCRTFPAEPFRDRRLDLFVASYPCQGFSLAGKRLGKDDPRFLWPYVRGFVEAVRPVRCFFENVRGHVSLGLSEVLRDLAELRYAVEPGIFSAEECGGGHQRERVFILARDMAVADNGRLRGDEGGTQTVEGCNGQDDGLSGAGSEDVADHPQPRERGLSEFTGRPQQSGVDIGRCDKALAEPSFELRDGSGRTGAGGRPEPANGGGQMADARGQGLQERRGIGRDVECECPSSFGSRCPCLPASPPGPDDFDGWCEVISSHPEMAPALPKAAQCIIHGMADVLAHGVDRCRVDRLRLCGNGVYPETAALAWTVLNEKMRRNFGE